MKFGVGCLSLAVFLAITPFNLSFAHEGEVHTSGKNQQPTALPQSSIEAAKLINESYRVNVELIFRKSCFDCHSAQTEFPWYKNFPGIKQLIASDIAEARTHLDMSKGFPFRSHSSPLKDLEAIRKVVGEESMPPVRYWMLHPGSKLKNEERKIVFDWVNEGLKHLSPAR